MMELADSIIINKADGDNKIKARAAKAEFNRILHLLQPSTPGWISQAYTASSLTGEGIEEIWSEIKSFKDKTNHSGYFHQRRQRQMLDWMYNMVEEHLRFSFLNHSEVNQSIPDVEKSVMNGTLTATLAAKHLLTIFESNGGRNNDARDKA